MSENHDERVRGDIDDSVEAHGITDTGQVLPAETDKHLEQLDDSVEGHGVNFRPVDNGGTPGLVATADHRPAADAGHLQIAEGSTTRRQPRRNRQSSSRSHNLDARALEGPGVLRFRGRPGPAPAAIPRPSGGTPWSSDCTSLTSRSPAGRRPSDPTSPGWRAHADDGGFGRITVTDHVWHIRCRRARSVMAAT